MKTVSFGVPAAALAIALFAASASAFAQSPPPSRNGNTWNGAHHQPTEAQVRHKESAAGVAPTPAQRAATTSTINHLNQEILDRSHG